MLESLVEKTSNRKSPRRDMDSAHVKTIEEFLQSSFIWSYVMNLHCEFMNGFARTLQQVSL